MSQQAREEMWARERAEPKPRLVSERQLHWERQQKKLRELKAAENRARYAKWEAKMQRRAERRERRKREADLAWRPVFTGEVEQLHLAGTPWPKRQLDRVVDTRGARRVFDSGWYLRRLGDPLPPIDDFWISPGIPDSSPS